MSQITIELEIPNDWKQFKLPTALDTRLQSLLDKQDETGQLTATERREAKAITQLVDMLTLMKLRVKNADSSSQ